jgi:hypothetical protein
MFSTIILSLLASSAFAQLSESNLKTYVGSLSLSASFNPIKESYWTGLPHHRRTPFAVSPDGKSAYLAYLDASETDVHVQQVDPSTFAAVGDAVTVIGGKEAGGLVAHNDGFALLTNEAMPLGTTNAPPDSTPVAVLYRYKSGKQTFKIFLGGPDNVGDMGALASPDMNGDLAFSEVTGMYGAYFVVTAYSGDAQGHFGDAIQYVNGNGTLEQIQGASSSWGCSHNTGIAFEAADSVPFPSICSEDQGAIWLNTGGTGMDKSGVKISNENVTNGAGNEAMGGMSGSYSGLARFVDSDSYIFSWVSRGAKDLTENEWMGTGYTHSANRTVNRNVAIATFSDKKTLVGKQATSELVADGDSQINWITTGSNDCQNAHVAAFDDTNAIVTWEEIAGPTCDFIAMGCKGAFSGSYFQLVDNGKKVGEPVKSMDVYVAGDMVTMSDGRICWPYVDMDWTLDGPVSNPVIVKAISFACMGLNGTNEATTPAASSAQASSKTPAASSKVPATTTAVPVQSSPATVDEVAVSIGVSSIVEITAGYGMPSAPAPSHSALPTFELVTSGATITPPSTSAPLATSTSNPLDDDQPKPSESVQVPASESFIASEAPAFSLSIDLPLGSLLPVYSSTSCSSTVEPTETPITTPFDDDQPKPSASIELPASESFIASEAPAFTGTIDIPLASFLPVYSSTPCSSTVTPTQAPETSTGTLPIETPEPATSTPCSEGGAQSTDATLSEYYPSGTGMRPSSVPTSLPPYPIDSDTFSYYPSGTGMRSSPSGVPYPTGTGRPSWHHGHRPYGGFGWGRPRPSGMWPAEHYHYPRPTGGFHHAPRPSAAFDTNGKASSTPCTLETRVRPTATALVR